MAKEIERAGIPTALITAMASVAESVGAPRIVSGPSITFPTGNPSLPPDQEKQLRRRIVQLALEALSTPVDKPRIFRLSSEGAGEAAIVGHGARWLH